MLYYSCKSVVCGGGGGVRRMNTFLCLIWLFAWDVETTSFINDGMFCRFV